MRLKPLSFGDRLRLIRDEFEAGFVGPERMTV